MTELIRRVTQDDMTRYSREGNIHSDLEVARSVGLDRTIAQGMMTLAYASELMTSVCGAEWLERGRISVKFTVPVYAGDVVRLTAEPGPDGSYGISATNQDDVVVMAGEASLG